MTDPRNTSQNNKKSLRFKLNKLCEEYGVEILYAFGSRAAEMMRAVGKAGRIKKDVSSDVDIAVKSSFGRRMSVREKSELALRFEDLFGVHNVDLVSLSEADPFLAVNIIRGERLYAVNERTADEYDLYILRKAGDLSRFEHRRIAGVLTR